MIKTYYINGDYVNGGGILQLHGLNILQLKSFFQYLLLNDICVSTLDTVSSNFRRWKPTPWYKTRTETFEEGLGNSSNNYLGKNVQSKKINVVFPQDIQNLQERETTRKNKMTWKMERKVLNSFYDSEPEFDRKLESYSLNLCSLFFKVSKIVVLLFPNHHLCRNYQLTTKKEVVCAYVLAGDGHG